LKAIGIVKIVQIKPFLSTKTFRGKAEKNWIEAVFAVRVLCYVLFKNFVTIILFAGPSTTIILQVEGFEKSEELSKSKYAQDSAILWGKK